MPFTKESTARSAKAGDITLSYHEAGESTDVGGGLPLVMLHGGEPVVVAHHGRLVRRTEARLVDEDRPEGQREPRQRGSEVWMLNESRSAAR